MDTIQKEFVELLERMARLFREKKEASLIAIVFMILIFCTAVFRAGENFGEFLYYLLH
jgi:hypothetical protein